MYNGKFRQCLEVIINTEDHSRCLHLSNIIKSQCDAWFFNVKYNENKSARKGAVLTRTIMIYQTAYASDIVIFKEAIRRICFHLGLDANINFIDKGTEPENDLRIKH